MQKVSKGLFAAISMFLLATAVEAAITGSTGYPLSASDAICFTKTRTGTVTNVCTTVRTLCVSDYITSSGAKSVVANGFIPNGGAPFTCTATAVNQAGGIVSSESQTLNTINVNTSLSPMNVNVPSFGALTVCCNLTPNSRINTINY